MSRAKWKLNDNRVSYLLKPEELSLLPHGTLLVDIFGEQVVYGEDKVDLDTRGGYLAYGLLDDPKFKLTGGVVIPSLGIVNRNK